MSPHTFGRLLQFTSFGESHGPAYGCVITGMPAGINYEASLLSRNMERRRPGQHKALTARSEDDTPEILSGIHEGKTLGTPIGVLVRNTNAKSEDYAQLEAALDAGQTLRSGHADDLWRAKFGHSDVRGGGRASGRETLCRVIAGSFAQMFLSQSIPQLKVHAFASQIGPLSLSTDEEEKALNLSSTEVDEFSLRFPHSQKNQDAEKLLINAKKEGDSWGGSILLSIQGLPAGLGQPLFGKLKADLAAALMGIGTSMGVSLGQEFFDPTESGKNFHQHSEKYAGVRGGISTGEPIVLRLYIKAPSTTGQLAKQGRHDPCIIPRAIPVVESMVNCVLADQLLYTRLDQA